MSATEVMQSPQKLSSQQLRKIKKPIIEKRRRERINESLNQLKSLVLDALNKDESQYNKMEKADILEMTVKHLKNLQHRLSSKGIISPQQPPDMVNRYKTGFKECTQEVTRYLNSVPTVHPQMKEHLGDHLSLCANNIESSKTVVKSDLYDSVKQQPTVQGQIMSGIQLGLPVMNSGNQQVMLTTTGPISPVNATQGFVPVIISPNNSVSILSPDQQHQLQQTSPLPGSVIPLYSHTSIIQPLHHQICNTLTPEKHCLNDSNSENVYYHHSTSPPSSNRSSPSLYSEPSSPVMTEHLSMNHGSHYSEEPSYTRSKALNFNTSPSNLNNNNENKIVTNNCSFDNSKMVHSYRNTTSNKLQHTWGDYTQDMYKYGREILVQSPNSSVWRPW